MAQTGKNPLAMQETWVRSLVWEDPLEWERLSSPVFWSGELHGQRSLAGYGPWGHRESCTTERPSRHVTLAGRPWAEERGQAAWLHLLLAVSLSRPSVPVSLSVERGDQ